MWAGTEGCAPSVKTVRSVFFQNLKEVSGIVRNTDNLLEAQQDDEAHEHLARSRRLGGGLGIIVMSDKGRKADIAS